MMRDPICGMQIDPQSAVAIREHMGQTFGFCSQSCLDQFEADSHKYAHQNDNAVALHSGHEQHQVVGTGQSNVETEDLETPLIGANTKA